MRRKYSADTQRGLNQAHRLLTKALDILDACKAPPSIALNVEMALAETKRALAETDPH